MTTLTQQFADEYAQKAVPGMLRTIRVNKIANKGILLGAVAASYLHQAHFLDDLGAGVFSWILPGVFDLGIVSMLTITQATGMAEEAKRAALKVLVVIVLISGTVNFLAPGEFILRIIFAIVVGLVAGVEWVAGKIRPDFAAIEVRETELTSGTSQPANAAPAVNPALPATLANSGPGIGDVPARLVSAARMVTVQHRQTSTQPLTSGELATRLGTTPAIAEQLLAVVDNPNRINGNMPVLGGTQ